MIFVTDFSLPGMGFEEKITVSPAPMVILRCMLLAIRDRSPTYEGRIADIEKIAQIVHTAGIIAAHISEASGVFNVCIQRDYRNALFI